MHVLKSMGDPTFSRRMEKSVIGLSSQRKTWQPNPLIGLSLAMSRALKVNKGIAVQFRPYRETECCEEDTHAIFIYICIYKCTVCMQQVWCGTVNASVRLNSGAFPSMALLMSFGKTLLPVPLRCIKHLRSHSNSNRTLGKVTVEIFEESLLCTHFVFFWFDEKLQEDIVTLCYLV